MKHRVDSQYGKAVYSHRMSVVEPVFGNIGTNKGLDRFGLRGRKKHRRWEGLRIGFFYSLVISEYAECQLMVDRRSSVHAND